MFRWITARPSDLSPGIPPDTYVEASWFWRRLVAIDQLFNVWVLNGLPDETISSHAGRRMRDDAAPPIWARFTCRLCNYFETDHCRKAIGS